MESQRVRHDWSNLAHTHIHLSHETTNFFVLGAVPNSSLYRTEHVFRKQAPSPVLRERSQEQMWICKAAQALASQEVLIPCAGYIQSRTEGQRIDFAGCPLQKRWSGILTCAARLHVCVSMEPWGRQFKEGCRWAWKALCCGHLAVGCRDQGKPVDTGGCHTHRGHWAGKEGWLGSRGTMESKVLVVQSYPTLQPHCSLPGSSAHGISQARILEQVAIPFFRGSSRPRDQTRVSCTADGFFTIRATREAQVSC